MRTAARIIASTEIMTSRRVGKKMRKRRKKKMIYLVKQRKVIRRMLPRR